jgi:hypothetical protein
MNLNPAVQAALGQVQPLLPAVSLCCQQFPFAASSFQLRRS